MMYLWKTYTYPNIFVSQNTQGLTNVYMSSLTPRGLLYTIRKLINYIVKCITINSHGFNRTGARGVQKLNAFFPEEYIYIFFS